MVRLLPPRKAEDVTTKTALARKRTVLVVIGGVLSLFGMLHEVLFSASAKIRLGPSSSIVITPVPTNNTEEPQQQESIKIASSPSLQTFAPSNKPSSIAVTPVPTNTTEEAQQQESIKIASSPSLQITFAPSNKPSPIVVTPVPAPVSDVLRCSSCLSCDNSTRLPALRGVVFDGSTIVKGRTFFRHVSFGNSLSLYWAARAMAELGGYEYRGSVFGGGTWVEFLPTAAPAKEPQKEFFELACAKCDSWMWFHRGTCHHGWASIAPTVSNGTRSALRRHADRSPKEENDAIFSFFGPNDWLIYNRCCVFSHGDFAPGTLKTYDAIPAEGDFQVFIMSGRKEEDPFNLCDEFIPESVEYMKKRNPGINVTMLERSSLFVDFARLVFAPNVLVAGSGSSWTLWSAIMSNNNNVVSLPPSMDAPYNYSLFPKNVKFLTDVPLVLPIVKGPQGIETAKTVYGIDPGHRGRFSNTSEAREAVLQYFRQGT